MRLNKLVVVVGWVVLGACSAERVGADVGDVVEVDEDAQGDVVEDVPRDVGADTGGDVGADTGVDVGADTDVDVGADTGADVGDVIEDVQRDVGADTGVDAMTDADVDGPGCPEVPCEPGQLCEGGVCVCDPTPVSFAVDVAPRLATGCGPGCHVYNGAVTSGSAGLNLAKAFAHAELVGVPASQCGDEGRLRVRPGEVRASYLMDKMLGRDMCRGVKMPKGRSAWEEPELALLGRWICQGALDN